MTVRGIFVQEAATLAPKRSDGTYPVVLIDEGRGSTGIYSAELLKNSAHVFEGVPSFINHPIDPSKPHERDLNNIAGRISNVRVEERKGKVALVGTYKPRTEYASLFEEFGDIIGLSIFCGAAGDVLEDGRVSVQEFDATDPYRSVDAVVAAGRGGRFERASESLRAIESSLGLPDGEKPGAASAPGEQEEGSMDEVLKAIEALTKTLEPVVTFVAEQKVAADAAVAAAEAKAEAAEQEKDAALESYSAAAQAVADAELLPSQESEILAAAKAGKDIAPLIENAKKVVNEAKTAVAAKAPGYIIEAAAGTSGDDFTVTQLGGGR